jgi:hypothetical protein
MKTRGIEIIFKPPEERISIFRFMYNFPAGGTH